MIRKHFIPCIDGVASWLIATHQCSGVVLERKLNFICLEDGFVSADVSDAFVSFVNGHEDFSRLMFGDRVSHGSGISTLSSKPWLGDSCPDFV